MRRVSRPAVAVLTLAIFLFVTSVALAAIVPKGTEDAGSDKLVGAVVSVDTKGETVVVRDTMRKGNVSKEVTFHLAKKPRIIVNGNAARLEDLKPGTEVKVSFRHEGKKRVAHSIETTTKTK